MTNFTLTNGADSFPGGGHDNSGHDSINALNGDDTVYAGLGNDTVLGGSGLDKLHGEAGFDVLDGGNGADSLYGGDGNDTLIGGGGQDVLDGGAGTNTAGYSTAAIAVGINLSTGIHSGDAQGDTFSNISAWDLGSWADTFLAGTTGVKASGFGGNDTLTGGSGADSLFGGNNNDSVTGSGGADLLSGESGTDTVLGGDGNDVIAGGSMGDSLDGGADVDMISYLASSSAVYVDLDGGIILGGDAGGDSLSNFEIVNLSGHADTFIANTSAYDVRGNSGADTLTGNTGADTLNGGDGDDLLNGNNADDRLIGGFGDDTLNGGGGTDTAVFIGSRFDWTVIDNGGGSLSVENDFSAETDSLTGIEQLEFDDGAYTLGGANNDPETRDSQLFFDINWILGGGIAFYGDVNGHPEHAFDADGDTLTASLVADNTGPDIDLGYANGSGAIVLTFSSEVELGTYDYTWKVNDGTADSNVSTMEIVIYDSLA